MVDPHPIFDPIREGIFGNGTPLTHQRRLEESCSGCNAVTPHDYFKAILGLHFGFGLPFGRKSTAGKLGRRSHWAFCAICGAATPLDEAAVDALQKAGVIKPDLSLKVSVYRQHEVRGSLTVARAWRARWPVERGPGSGW